MQTLIKLHHILKEKRIRHLIIDGLLFIIIVLLYFTKWIEFPYKLPVIAVCIMGLTFYKNKNLHEIGFLSKVSISKTIFWALLIFIVGIIVGKLLVPFLENFFGAIDYSAYGALEGNKEAVIQLWMYAMISAAFAEDVIFRGYFCSLFESYIGTSTIARYSMVVSGALLFTFAHYSQGMTGLMSIFVVSLLFYIVFIISGKNIYGTILGHALIDTFGLYQIYLGSY